MKRLTQYETGKEDQGIVLEVSAEELEMLNDGLASIQDEHWFDENHMSLWGTVEDILESLPNRPEKGPTCDRVYSFGAAANRCTRKAGHVGPCR